MADKCIGDWLRSNKPANSSKKTHTALTEKQRYHKNELLSQQLIHTFRECVQCASVNKHKPPTCCGTCVSISSPVENSNFRSRS